MMMKACLAAVLLLLAGGAARGQAYRGVRLEFRYCRVVLATDDTLSGYAALRLGPDLLCLALADGKVRAFEPTAVKAFVVQGQVPVKARGVLREPVNPDSTVVRLFRSVPRPAQHAGGPVEVVFFEQLSGGPVLLLRRPYAYTLTVPTRSAPGTSGMYPQRFRVQDELREAYYLALENGELRPIHAFRKDILAAFPAHAQQLGAYVRSHGLNDASARDLSELVNYANSLDASPAAP